MKLTDQERLELNELCNALVDGVMTGEQRRRLEQLLANSPDARRFYIRAMALSASLFDYAGEMQAEAPERARQTAGVARPGAWWWAFGSLAAAASIALAFWLGGVTSPGPGVETVQPETVAHLSGSKDCVWTGPVLRPGAELPGGQRVELAAGWAEITFDSGAQVVLEGPASLDVNSAWEAVLRRGALKASVPPEAIGFRVGNAAVDVVDLGTEFSMVADENGATEVFVLQGAVEAKPRTAASEASRPTVLLREKQSRRFARSGVSDVLNSEQKFQRFLRKVSLDPFLKPATFVHWSFDEAAGDRVAAEVTGKPSIQHDAQLDASSASALAAARIDSRWQRALNCNGQLSAKALLPAFAQRAPRTVAFWIQVPADASAAESEAMLGWPPAATGGAVEFSWNRTSTQGTFGALRTTVDRGFLTGNTSLRDGQWHHIAIVFTFPPRAPQRLQIRQYVDGRLDGASARLLGKRIVANTSSNNSLAPAADDATLWIGRKVSDAGKPGFRGAMDELFIVDRALSQREIRMLMVQNRLPAPGTLAAK